MVIARIDSYIKRTIALVCVTCDDGAQGWGQMSPYNADITAQIFHRQVAPHALGADPREINRLIDRIGEKEHKFPGSYLCRALAGLDTALWDLAGKAAGKSVSELLGASVSSYPAYASSMRRDITPAAEAERLARLADLRGFDAFKIRVGSECGHDVDEWPGRSKEVVAATRKALGPESHLLVDANSGFSAPGAIETGRMLLEHGVEHFEEPCPYWDLEATRTVTNSLDLSVAGGEQDHYLPWWEHVISSRTVDIVQPDVCYVGGFSRALRVARMADDAGLPCVPHSANLSLVTVFTLHLMAAIPNAGPYIEYSIEPDSYYPWQVGIYDPPLLVMDGRANVPQGPGWGVTIRQEWLAHANQMTTS